MEKKTGQCPLGAKCEEVIENVMYVCPWFVNVRGTDPNSGEDVNSQQCAMAWMPILLIENSGQQRQTGAAIESFRNEMVGQNKEMLSLAANSNKKLPG